jgi:N utilization substance protein A
VNLSQVIEELVEEKDIDRALLSAIVCEGMLAAYKKKYPHLNLSAVHNKQTDQIDVLIEKRVAASVEDDELEVSARKARIVNPRAQVDDMVLMPFDGTIGRIEILRAKQVISQRIRAVESSQIYNEYKPKEGTLVYGVVHKCDPSGVVVKIQDVFAFLPKSLLIPGDRCVVGYPVRALLKEVLPEPRNENQLILDRTSIDFLRQLFEIEIPEIFERIVEIRKIVRVPGYKSKVVVVSTDKNIDPVGTCVGVGGARIKPILRELGAEKIDIIADTPNQENFVRESLKPAAINRVEIDGETARIWLDEDQRSVAIGKLGKNILLASQLTGLQIELVKSGERSGGSPDDVFIDTLDDTRDEQGE